MRRAFPRGAGAPSYSVRAEHIIEHSADEAFRAENLFFARIRRQILLLNAARAA